MTNYDYYLIIGLNDHGENINRYIYNYEERILYIPENYETIIDMIKVFNTTYVYELVKTPKGKEYLIKNGFARLRHDVFELYEIWEKFGVGLSPYIYIGDDGICYTYNAERVFE